jgi:6-phosphofructokinase 1
MITSADTVVVELGARSVRSPLALSTQPGDSLGDFTPDGARVLYDARVLPGKPQSFEVAFDLAGPREWLYFDPAKTTAAIVTCGGLCPGLNNVIRSVYLELTQNYGVGRVLGIRDGYLGLNSKEGRPPIELTRELVEDIHLQGGTILGSSRGPQEPAVMADSLIERKIDILFCVGGDGTQRGAHAVELELRKRKAPIAVVGVPKTIDNDIEFIEQSFGHVTAIEKATEVLRAAHVEARAVHNGVGLVKLMGRHAGFIAAGAALASQECNFVLTPEIPFPLEGEDGFLAALEKRLAARRHALVAVAEGAGQSLFENAPTTCDASGNVRPHDIGAYLKERIMAHFQSLSLPVNVRYIDPSYMIRGVPANCFDRLLCDALARSAVHAAMSGQTGCLIGRWNGAFIHVPIPTAVARKRRLEIEGQQWTNVLLCTGQPRWRER